MMVYILINPLQAHPFHSMMLCSLPAPSTHHHHFCFCSFVISSLVCPSSPFSLQPHYCRVDFLVSNFVHPLHPPSPLLLSFFLSPLLPQKYLSVRVPLPCCWCVPSFPLCLFYFVLCSRSSTSLSFVYKNREINVLWTIFIEECLSNIVMFMGGLEG